MINFDAEKNEDVVNLLWSAASEINNDYFTIEKTIDGITFEEVDGVKGGGNSTSLINYEAINYRPYENISYYRLRQTDFDGNFSYSDLKMVNFTNDNAFSFNLFPNPNDGESVNVQFESNDEKEVLVVVYDILGKKLFSKVIISFENDNNVFAIDPSNRLQSGVYLITSTTDDNIYTKTLIVK